MKFISEILLINAYHTHGRNKIISEFKLHTCIVMIRVSTQFNLDHRVEGHVSFGIQCEEMWNFEEPLSY